MIALIISVVIPTLLMLVCVLVWCLRVTTRALTDARRQIHEERKRNAGLEARLPLPGEVGTPSQLEQGEEVSVTCVVLLNDVLHLVLVTHGHLRLRVVRATNVTVDNRPIWLGTRGRFYVKFPRNADGSVNTNLPVRLETVTEGVRVYA